MVGQHQRGAGELFPDEPVALSCVPLPVSKRARPGRMSCAQNPARCPISSGLRWHMFAGLFGSAELAVLALCSNLHDGPERASRLQAPLVLQGRVSRAQGEGQVEAVFLLSYKKWCVWLFPPVMSVQKSSASALQLSPVRPCFLARGVYQRLVKILETERSHCAQGNNFLRIQLAEFACRQGGIK